MSDRREMLFTLTKGIGAFDETACIEPRDQLRVGDELYVPSTNERVVVTSTSDKRGYTGIRRQVERGGSSAMRAGADIIRSSYLLRPNLGQKKEPIGSELAALLLLSELKGYFNAVTTPNSPIEATLTDFAGRVQMLIDELLEVRR